MKIVIQCAARKRQHAGHLRNERGESVLFVAEPQLAPRGHHVVYARPDDRASEGQTWRERLMEVNRSPQTNSYGLLSAVDLYENPAYRGLAAKFGHENLYILSAGWGLIPANFLTPAYDITFSAGADPYKRRRTSPPYEDLCLLPTDSDESLLFLGGKDYLHLFDRLTARVRGKRIVLFNSATTPRMPGCDLLRFVTTTRTNWHYEAAQALISGSLQLPA